MRLWNPLPGSDAVQTFQVWQGATVACYEMYGTRPLQLFWQTSCLAFWGSQQRRWFCHKSEGGLPQTIVQLARPAFRAERAEPISSPEVGAYEQSLAHCLVAGVLVAVWWIRAVCASAQDDPSVRQPSKRIVGWRGGRLISASRFCAAC